MKKVEMLLMILLVLIYQVSAQDNFQGNKSVLAINNSTGSAAFYVYNPPLKLKAIYKDTIEAKNEFPEQLMISILSSSSQGWENYNQLGGKADKKDLKHFATVKKMDKEKNHFELHNKYEFLHNGIPTVILKFYVYLAEKKGPVSGSVTMQNVNGRWYRTALPGTSELAIAFMRFKSDKLELLLTGNAFTGDKMIDDVLAKIKNPDGSVDQAKLLAEYGRWYQITDQAKIDYFIDKKAW